MKIGSYKDFQQEADDISRRSFLGKLGKGAATVAAVPWTKLLSSPELAAKVSAPFKIGYFMQTNHAHFSGFMDDFQIYKGIAFNANTIIEIYQTNRE